MEWWQILGLLAAGAFGLGKLAGSSAAQASAAQPANSGSGLSPADLALLNKVFLAAMATETNLNVLEKFSAKLHAAGFKSYGDSIDSKINSLSRFTAAVTRTNIQMVPQTQTAADGSTYTSTATNPPVQS